MLRNQENKEKVGKMLKRESIRDWMKPQIAHSLPGRLRLVVPGLEYIQAERV